MPRPTGNTVRGSNDRDPSGGRSGGHAGAAISDQGATPLRVNEEISLLVAAGSAMAAGCEPCLDQLIPNLIQAGVRDEDIRRALDIGQHVRQAAAEYISEVANVLADPRPGRAPGPTPSEDEEDRNDNGCCSQKREEPGARETFHADSL